MLIHSFDQGRRTGYAFGPAGEAPVRRGFLILRESSEPRCVGFWNLIDYLNKLWTRSKPDILIIEEPQSITQWHETNKKKKFPTNPSGVQSGFELTSIITGIAEGYEITRVETVRRQSVLKHLVGKGNLSREEGKAACLQFLKDGGYIEPNSNDEDQADAIAMHIYASDVFARVPQAEFRLFPAKSA